jgi:hypothetical protein
MADTKHHAATPAPFDGGSGRPEHGRGAPVEGDGVSYKGIVWFVVLLAGTTIICQLLMWVLLKAFKYQNESNPAATSPLAQTVTERDAPTGRVYPEMKSVGLPNGPQPRLLVREPANLAEIRAHEHEVLSTYDWVDKSAGVIRMPIEKAKEKLLEQGLPVRGTEPAAAKALKPVKDVKK